MNSIWYPYHNFIITVINILKINYKYGFIEYNDISGILEIPILWYKKSPILLAIANPG